MGRPEPPDGYVGWREADLHVRQPRGRLRLVRALAWATALAAFVVLLMDVQRDPVRCHPNCFDGSDNTFEAGHVWSAYGGSWQWEAQLFIGWVGFLVSLWALYAAGRRGRAQTVASVGIAVALVLTWIVWVSVQPGPAQLT